MYVGPSLTVDRQSAYKIYFADGARDEKSTWEVTDHETWVLNLTESNRLNTPFWFKALYETAKGYYDLESLRPEAYYELVKKMTTDRSLFEKFHK